MRLLTLWGSDATMRMTSQLTIGAMSVALVLAVAPADAAWWNLRKDAGPPAAGAETKAPVVLAQSSTDADRFNRVEAQMRTLTGQVEELTFQLRQLQEQLARTQEDNEFRFRDLEGGGSPTPRPEGSIAAPSGDVATPGAPDGEAPPDAIGGVVDQQSVLDQLGAPPGPLGTLTLDAPPNIADQPIDLTAPPPSAGSGSFETAMTEPTGDARADYERAYRTILSGDYDAAELGFKQFIAAYPDDELAPDAQYWLGESLFIRGQYREAANEFLAGYKAYPKSGKAPDALLKLGLSLAGLGEREAACSTFTAVLKQYPEASNALLQRVKVEQSSASC